MKFFNSLSPQGKLITIIIVVLLIIYIWRKYGYRITGLFQKKEITKQTVVLQNGQTVELSSIADLPESQKVYIQSIADSINDDLTKGSYFGARLRNLSGYIKANSLSDVEIDYLASYYKSQLNSGTSLYHQMDGEWLSPIQDNSSFKELMNKLLKTGNK